MSSNKESDGAAAGAAAQATANTNAQPTGTADAEQQTELTNHSAPKQQLYGALQNWQESEAYNLKLQHVLMQLVRAIRAKQAGLRPGQDISDLVSLADRLAEENLLAAVRTDDEAGAASDDSGDAGKAGARKKPKV